QELPNLTSLTNLQIYCCLSAKASFPRGLWPPKLHTLHIGWLKKPILEWGPQNFPTSLVNLTLYGDMYLDDDDVSRCSQLSHLIPSSLTSLGIMNFEKLKSVSVGLQHLTSLQHLSLGGCPKMKHLPDILLPSLLSLNIKECPKLEGSGEVLVDGSLACLAPPEEGLPSLKELYIEDMNEVKAMGSELIGTGDAFRSLEVFELQNMKKLEEWSTDSGVVLFPCLKQLLISDCPNLVKVSIDALPSLDILNWCVEKADDCESMEHCRCPNNTEYLSIYRCTSITSASFPTTGGQKLNSPEIDSCNKLLEKELEGDNSREVIKNTSISKLQYLVLHKVPNLTTAIELSHFIHLTYLVIMNYSKMESFPDQELPNLTSLTNLHILCCPSANASFPRGLWPPKLHTLHIGGLKKPILEWGPQNFPTSLVNLTLYGDLFSNEDVSRCSQLSHLIPSSLTSLGIVSFKKLKSVAVGLQHLTSLQHLYLGFCPKMKHLPDILLPSLLSLKIKECPKLEGRCSRRGSYWSRISHIPCITINPEALYKILPPKNWRSTEV
ncbi:hypothetical protein M8C21_001730, partial [Ambrosia artemisiifolia]